MELVSAVLILLSSVLSVESQGRFFLKKPKPFVTVTRVSTSTFTDTIFPTCFEVLGVGACGRRKKQMAFLVNPLDYYHAIVPHQVIRIEPTSEPEYRLIQPVNSYFDFLSYLRPKPAPAPPIIESSFQPAESEGRFFGTNLVTFTTRTTTDTTKVTAKETQSLELNCIASGKPIPPDEQLCTIKLTFGLPAGVDLQKFCEGAAKVAKMKLAGFKFVNRRRRQVTAREDVFVTTPCQCEFFRIPGGDFPSRKKIAENFISFCGTKNPLCNIPDVGKVDLRKIGLPGFDSIYQAAGTSLQSGSAAA